MKFNKKLFVVVICLVISLVTIFFTYKKSSIEFLNNYKAVFIGEKENIIYRTYIYKINNGQANLGFKYINTKEENNKEKIVKKGEFDWTDGAFIIAKKHGAYDYVKLPSNDKKYSIEEFQKMFIMD